MPAMSAERLQKILAQAGVASRRSAEQLIKGGRVRVNGRVVKELGTKADPVRDKVEVDGRRLVAEQPVYYLLHKPREVVTTLDDPEKRASVADLMKSVDQRIFPVGRLDYHTSGALLLTNDGEMTQALLHPRKSVPKTYIAKVKGAVSLPQLQALREGVTLDDGHKTRKADLFVLNEERGNTWLQITITEGKNRQIHRMGEAIGHRVMRLSRLAFAGLSCEGLRPGQSRQLTDGELAKLKRDYVNPTKRKDGTAPLPQYGVPRQKPASSTHVRPPRKPRPATFPATTRDAQESGPRKEFAPRKELASRKGPRLPTGQRSEQTFAPRKDSHRTAQRPDREFAPRKDFAPRKGLRPPMGQRTEQQFAPRKASHRTAQRPDRELAPRKDFAPRKGPRPPMGQRTEQQFTPRKGPHRTAQRPDPDFAPRKDFASRKGPRPPMGQRTEQQFEPRKGPHRTAQRPDREIAPRKGPRPPTAPRPDPRDEVPPEAPRREPRSSRFSRKAPRKTS